MTSRSLLAGVLLAALACAALRALTAHAPRRTVAVRAAEGADAGRTDASELAPARAPAERQESRRVPAGEPGAGASTPWYGRVLDAQSGAPLAGATLKVRAAGPAGERTVKLRKGKRVRREGYEVRSGPDGRFPPLPLPQGGARAILEHPRHAPLALRLGPGHAAPASECVLALARTAALTIRLRDARGGPLDGYTLLAHREDGAARPQDARTDADGACELAELLPQVPLALELLRGEERLRAWPEPLVLQPDERRTLEWTIGDGCRVAGIVLDPAGGALSGAHLGLLAGEQPDPREAESDAEGRFAFDDVPAGDWRLELTAPLPGLVLPGVALALAAGEERRELVLRAEQALFIRGTVVSPLGDPLPRVALSARGLECTFEAEGRSRKDGSFVLGPLPAGPFALALEPPGMHPLIARPAEVVCGAGADGIVLRLAAGGQVSGRVHGCAGGGLARVVLAGALPPYPEPEACVADEAGAFRFGNLQPGLYELAACDARGWARMAPVEVEPLRAMAGVELELVAGARLELVLDPAAGSGAEVELWSGPHLLASAWLEPGQRLASAGPPGMFRCRLRGAEEELLRADEWLEALSADTAARTVLALPRAR